MSVSLDKTDSEKRSEAMLDRGLSAQYIYDTFRIKKEILHIAAIAEILWELTSEWSFTQERFFRYPAKPNTKTIEVRICVYSNVPCLHIRCFPVRRICFRA